jgi:hypothetical protein
MPGSFELQGGIVIDLAEVENLPAMLEAALAGLHGGEAAINVVANTAEAQDQVETLTKDAQALTSKPIMLTPEVDTAPAQAGFQKIAEEAQVTAGKVKEAGAEASQSFNMQSMAGGLMMMGIGAGGALGLKSMLTEGVTGSIRQARLESNMSNIMGSPEAGAQTVSQDKALSKATGYDPTTIMTTTANLMDMQEEMGTTGDQIEALTGRIADIARSSGLPQYANNMDAVRTAISQGIASGRGLGLRQLGINIGAPYMKDTFEGGKYKATYDKMDPTAQAQLRYQAVMEQTTNIAGTAGQASTEKSFGELKTAAEEAGNALGKGITPALKLFANVVSILPKPVLAAGMVLGGLAALMIPLAMMGFGIKGAASLGKGVVGGVKGVVGKFTGKSGGDAATEEGGAKVAKAETDSATLISTAGKEGAAKISETLTQGAEQMKIAFQEMRAEMTGGGAEIAGAETTTAAEVTTGGAEIEAAETTAAAGIATKGAAAGVGIGTAGMAIGAELAIVSAVLVPIIKGWLKAKAQNDEQTAKQPALDKYAQEKQAAEATGNLASDFQANAAAAGIGAAQIAQDMKKYTTVGASRGSQGQLVWMNAQGQQLSASAQANLTAQLNAKNAAVGQTAVTITVNNNNGSAVATDVGSHAATVR